MTVDEPTRHERFRWFAERIPPELAEAMTNSIPPSGWGEVATRTDPTTSGGLRYGEMAELRGEMHLGFAGLQRSFVVATIASVDSSWVLLVAALALN